MQRLAARISLLLTLTLLLAFILSACSSSGPRRSRGKLSDAAEEASKEPEKQESVERGSTWLDDDDDDNVATIPLLMSLTADQSDSTADQLDPTALGSEEPENTYAQKKHRGILFAYGWTHYASNELDPSHYFSIGYSDFIKAQLRTYFGAHGGSLKAGSQPLVANGFTNLSQLGLEGHVRFYATPDHTFMGLYGLAGARWGMLSWDYRHPIQVEGESDPIKSDWIQFWTLYIGAGVSLMQTEAVHLGLHGTVGFRTPYEYTEKDFKNDIFPDAGSQQIGLDVSILF